MHNLYANFLIILEICQDFYKEITRQYNDRKKFAGELCEKIRKRIVDKMDDVENIKKTTQTLHSGELIPPMRRVLVGF